MEKRQHWNGELLESDVWDVMEESRMVNEAEPAPIGLLSKQLQSSARLIPMGKNKKQGHGTNLVQMSAPVKIPNWCNVPHGNSSSLADHGLRRNSDDEYDEGCRLPPHEWLARKEERSQTSSFSVCEGVGRTLKGRDQRKVRHAVLTKTGFI